MIENKDQFHDLTGLDCDDIVTVLRAATRAADQETLSRFRTNLAVENKLAAGFDPVTEADKSAERAIRAVIENRFPNHSVIGEEHDNKDTGSPFAWIIDPIDGTRSFIAGVPLWGTLIGFAYQGRVLAGIMSQPFTGEIFLGLPGAALWHQRGGPEITLRTSGCTDMSSARLFSTSPSLFNTPARNTTWEALKTASMQTRYGCDCYAYCLLAAGHADIVVEPDLNVFDIAALIPIIEQAGGRLATWSGGSADNGGDIVAAATPELLDAALNLIAKSGTAF